MDAHAHIGRHPVERKKMKHQLQQRPGGGDPLQVLLRFRQYTHGRCRLETGRDPSDPRTWPVSIIRCWAMRLAQSRQVPGPGLQGQTLHAGV